MSGRYPSEPELKHIREYQHELFDYVPLMEYIGAIWEYADMGYFQRRGRSFHIHTGGWSGNEDIISAMRGNPIFWATCWHSSKRGGHYRFKCPKFKKKIEKQA